MKGAEFSTAGVLEGMFIISALCMLHVGPEMSIWQKPFPCNWDVTPTWPNTLGFIAHLSTLLTDSVKSRHLLKQL